MCVCVRVCALLLGCVIAISVVCVCYFVVHVVYCECACVFDSFVVWLCVLHVAVCVCVCMSVCA